MINRLLRTMAGLLRTLAIFMTLLGLAAGVAAWRLMAGPVAVDVLTPPIAEALNAALGTVRVEVEGSVLAWGGLDHPLEIRLRQVRAVASDGQTVASVPELAVGISVPALLRGRLALARVTLVRPVLKIERTPEGALVLDLHPLPTPGPSRDMVVEPAVESEALPDQIAAFLRLPPDPLSPLGALTTVSVTGAALTIDDRASGRVWRVPRAELSAERADDGITLKAGLESPLAGRLATLALEGRYRQTDGTARIEATLAGLEPAALAPLAPALAPLAALQMPLAGSASLALGADLRPVRLRVKLKAGAGTLGGPVPLALQALELTASLEPADGRLELESASASLGQPALTLSAAGHLERVFTSPEGRIGLGLKQGARQAQMELRALGRAGGDAGGPAQLKATLAGLEPAMLAPLIPALPPGLRLALAGQAELSFAPDWQPTRLDLDLSTGKGEVKLPELMPEPVAFAGASLRGSLERPLAADAALTLQGFTLDFGDARLSGSGSAQRQDRQIALKGEIKAHGVPVDALPRLWPPPVGKNARDWVVANLSHGMVEEAWLRVDGSAPLDDPSEILATTLEGGLTVTDLTVAYFKTLPPAKGINGHATTDGRSLIIQTNGGKVLDLAMGDGRIEISKLDTPQEWIDIDVPVSGSVRSTLMVLDTPPLGYARKLDLDPNKAEGGQSSRLHFYLPLVRKLELDDVELGVSGSLKGVGLQGLPGGFDASDGDLKLALDAKGMTITGTTRLEGMPVRLEWREAFADEANPRTRVALKGEIGAAELVRRGLAADPYFGGSVGADLVLTVDNAHRTALAGSLDLTPARLTLPPLSWSKASGIAGQARFRLEVPKGAPARIPALRIEGGGLRVSGSAELAPGGGLGKLSLSEFRAGATDLGAELHHRPDGIWEAALHGASLDLRSLLKGAEGEEKRRQRDQRLARRGKPHQPGPRYELSAQIGRLITADGGRALSNVLAQVRDDGLGLDRAEIDARVADSTATLTLRYRPEGHQRRLLVRSDDLGALLSALDVTDSIRGGRLSVVGLGDPTVPDRPITGQLELAEYRVVNAPLLARLLNAISITGLLDLLRGEGLAFSALAGEFRLADDLVTLKDLRTSGAALGLTVAGRVDLAADSLDLEGTVVPLYGFNRIIGMIPLLGDLISGGEGQGLFAATWYMRGPSDDPDVMVNPLAVLAPGFLRNLFFLGGSPRP
jgi:hypothetical protein